MTLELGLDLDGAEEHRYLGWKGIVQEKSEVIKEQGPFEPILSTSDVRVAI